MAMETCLYCGLQTSELTAHIVNNHPEHYFQQGMELRASVDRWRHRSVSMHCMTCMWFMPKASSKRDPAKIPDENTVGRCRRHAPTLGGYPVVYGDDWCGDHKLDEEKT